MIKPLLRTIPLYSGNVKMLCTLSDYVTQDDINYECYVRGAVLSPLSHTMYDKKIEANLLSSDYSYDLKKFYKYYSDVFYDNGMKLSTNSVKTIDLHNVVYDRNVDLEYGCSRSSSLDNELEFFAPIYIDSVDDIPDMFVISLKFKKGNKEIEKTISVNISEESKKNYLVAYLKTYASKLDRNVCYLSASDKKSMFFGIDLIHGGMTSSHTDLMNSLLSSQTTMNLFDLSLAMEFKKSKLAMKQVIPLCFGFSLDPVLTEQQKHTFKCTQVRVSGHYMKNGVKISLYDWSADYTRFHHKIKKMDENTGLMTIHDGELSNIMHDSYPGLRECNMQEYMFSNKISKMYSRWKMKSSDDSYPYIANASFSFSRNQGSISGYREFPSATSSMIALATPLSTIGSTGLSEDYSLIFPLDKGKDRYYDRYSSVIDKYEDQMNKYGYDWFDIVNVNDNDLDWVSDVSWKDVNDDECYYRGILHDLNNIYSKVSNIKNFHSLDKFAVIVNPTISIKDSTVVDDIKKAKYIVKTTKSNDYEANAMYNYSMISSMMYLGDEAKANCEMFLSTNPQEFDYNSEVTTNISFEKMSKDIMSYTYSSSDNVTFSYVPEMTSPAFVSMNDLGFTIDEVNTWYNYTDFMQAFSYVGKNVITDEYIRECSGVESQDTIEYAKSIFNSEDLVSLVNNKLDDTSTYICSSYELLPIHTMSLLVDSYETSNEDGTTSKQWSYLKFSGHNSYVSYKYGIKLHWMNDSTYEYDEWVYGKDHRQYVMDPKYDEELTYKICTQDADFLSYKLVEENVSTTIKGTNPETSVSYEYYWARYSDWSIYKSQMIENLYMSSKNDTTIRNNVMMTYWKDDYGIGHSYSYVAFSPQELITIPYGFNLYRKSDFISERWIKDIGARNVDQATYFEVSASYANGSNMMFNPSDFDKEGTSTYLLRKCVSSIYRGMSEAVTSRLSDKSKYTFYPVVHGDADIYARNVFIKKDSQKKFYGDKVKADQIDNDIDVVWCDAYNFRKILEKHGMPDEYKDWIRSSIKKNAKARLLDKDHLYWWYNELHKNFDYIDEGNIDIDWFDRIYVKNRKLSVDSDGNLQVVDCYNKLSSIHGMEETVVEDGNTVENIYRRFNYFFDRIEQRSSDGLWKFKDSANDDYGGALYDFTIDIDVIRLDNKIFEEIMKIDNSSEEYRDLYVYKIEDDDSWERKMSIGEITSMKYDDSTNDEEKPVGHLLVPLFTDIYVQEKEDTEIYARYLLHDISPVEVVGHKEINKIYRYASSDISWMLEISSDTIQHLSSAYGSPIVSEDGITWQPTLIEHIIDPSLSSPFKYSIANLLYTNFSNIKYQLKHHDLDELEYHVPGFITFTKDNVNYGAWVIDMDVDNTSNSIEMISQYDLSSSDVIHKYSYDNNIKWIKYINGIDIVKNNDYIMKVLRLIMPFLKSQPYSMLSDITTIVFPSYFTFRCRYEENSCMPPDNNTTVDEVMVNINDDANGMNICLYRYFGNIVPLIDKVTSVPDQWLIKFKDTVDKLSPIVSTGKFQSIGDSVLYRTSLGISSRNNYQVYDVSNDSSVRSYNNIAYEASTIEQKHFNDSVVLLLDKELEWTNRTLVAASEIEALESEEKEKEVLKMLYSGSNISALTEDEFLFLFNRYNVQVTSTPIKLNGDKTSKLYKVTYKYALK